MINGISSLRKVSRSQVVGIKPTSLMRGVACVGGQRRRSLSLSTKETQYLYEGTTIIKLLFIALYMCKISMMPLRRCLKAIFMIDPLKCTKIFKMVLEPQC